MKTISDALLTRSEYLAVECPAEQEAGLSGRATVRNALARNGLTGADLMGVSWKPEALPERRRIERPVTAKRVPWWKPYQRSAFVWAVALGLIFVTGMLMGRGL